MHGKDILYFAFGLIVLYAVGQTIYERVTGTDRESVARRETVRKAAVEKAEAEHAAFVREEAVRTFALKESPVLWQTIQELKANVAEQNGRLKRLEKTMKDVGMDPLEDADFLSMQRERDARVRRLDELRQELDRAYVASVKYEVSEGRAEKIQFEKKAREDGFSEAVQSREKYERLRKEK